MNIQQERIKRQLLGKPIDGLLPDEFDFRYIIPGTTYKIYLKVPLYFEVGDYLSSTAKHNTYQVTATEPEIIIKWIKSN